MTYAPFESLDVSAVDSWFESLLVDVSARFMSIPAEQIDSIIEDTQRLICARMQLDCSTLWQPAGESDIMELTHCYQSAQKPRLGNAMTGPLLIDSARTRRKAGSPPVYSRSNLTSFFPWIVQQTRGGRTVVISSCNDFPPEAALDRAILERYGSSSVVAIPLQLSGRWLGCLTFATLSHEREWNPGDIRRFELIARLISPAIGRKASLGNLRENEARLRAILDTAAEAIITINEHGGIESANVGAERIFGYSASELLGGSFSILMSQPYSREFDLFFAAGRNGSKARFIGACREIMGRRRDGSLFPVELTISEFKLDHRPLFTAFLRDIAERKQAEEALRASEHRFHLIADSAPVLIWMSNPQRGCIFVNKPWLTFTGHSLPQEAADGWLEGIHPDDREGFISRFHEAVDTRQPFVAHFRLRRKDGIYRWLVTSGVPHFEPDGRFAGYIGSCTDITEQKDAEKAAQDLSGLLIKSQEEQRARLARELHDDITQRLARLSIDAGRFIQSVSLPQPEEDLIRGVADGLGRLSQDVHALSYELHPSALIDLGLQEALRSECEQVSRRHSISAELKVRNLPRAIPREIAIGLFRIAQEGIRNALRHGRASHVNVALAGIDDGLSLVVRDDGRGFDVSRRRNTPSLGLSSMRERARLLSGELDIESEPGQGTTVVTWVPL